MASRKLATGKRVTSAECCAAIADRFAPKEWATVFNVGNATGWSHSRRADALSLNCFPSRGMELYGFEIKVSRGDWMRELRDPDKSGPIQDMCDRWYVVAGDEFVVKDGELPTTWGLLVLTKRSLVVKREAPKLRAKPWPREFVAAMMRAASEHMVPRSALAAMADEMYEKRRASDVSWKEQQFDKVTKDYEQVRAQLRAFEQASGITIGNEYVWPAEMRDPKRVGEAVRFLLTRGMDTNGMQGVLNLLDSTRATLTKAIELASQLPPPPKSEEAAQ